MKENERKANEFLEYIADNIELLRHNLRKNVNFSSEYTEEVINETAIKIYNTIIKNNTDIKDKKNYFFLASRNTHIAYDKADREKKSVEIRGLFDDEKFDAYEEENDEEERWNKTERALRKIKEIISKEFSERDTEIYLKYVYEKYCREKCSYKSIAEEYGISVREATNRINAIKEFMKEKEETINEIKKEYLN